MQESIDLAVIGGGASGFMGAITAAEEGVPSVLLLESTQKTLEKVRISGGGRCNVTNACLNPKELVENYPRGKKPLLGAFSRFATGDAIAWFEEKGLSLKIENDGRIFPNSNSSIEVIKCLHNAAEKAGVHYATQMGVQGVECLGDQGFKIKCRNQRIIYSKKILIATGNSPTGKKIASQLGHIIIDAVPSLFTFKLDAPWLTKCTGISVDNVNLKLIAGGIDFQQYGRVLITHWGLSGPAVLKLSAFAARHMRQDNYRCKLLINWSGNDINSIDLALRNYRKDYARNTLRASCPFKNIPKRLWLSILEKLNIKNDTKWANLCRSDEVYIRELIAKDFHKLKGKGPFGEEFVTAGGVDLKEIFIHSMESRRCKDVYFAGEVLNVDGITGGFNFQHCWSSGWIAGRAIAKDLLNK
ncbi:MULTISPECIES: NAD(P)/FAD-dependent oxidoreductase [Prochlorococcus]|uniref:Predicted flavoprotein n=1 Tax=Prochlorococcus marinus (strain SARG / CCMP1375 / SS120) TaxID=167539 RepID=Q7VDK0_PROMA|nr:MULTISPECIES: NAD(P)/FAD-dependent oxidoreductase [Prochlorococcus]AAP99422.1 Predicted flavoprotein [Prochlorococcus marinus subsp. marinus str. CCMP1375]KGG11310.1 hypothetical protein EV04_1388 [Prochlorococcus marinus str. LG]KGG18735.1 hypothetical protein EV08_1984 [Prochlorococcus marinus str. SS2]KGG23009.1 hypothetical protein EV09_1752 [Prochlorococcus marinus str. SS35]KGG33715.1 hypothetical protein EV10_0150 [Prochlorococcus marinus str. SS51]